MDSATVQVIVPNWREINLCKTLGNAISLVERAVSTMLPDRGCKPKPAEFIQFAKSD
jgi:hypothetical protein